MNVITSGSRTTWLLTAASIILAALMGLLASSDIIPITSSLPATAEVTRAPTLRPVASGLELGPVEHYAAVIERPLFNAARRPPPPPAEPVPVEAVAAHTPPPLTLEGVVLAPERRSAIFRSITTSKIMRVNEGSPLGEWTLEALEADRVVLRRRDSAHEITLRQFDSGPAVGSGMRYQTQRQRGSSR